MKITEFLHADAVIGSLTAKDKPGILGELAASLAPQLGLPAEKLTAVLLDREKLSSTGMQDGVAIPHGKIPGLAALTAAFGVHREGVEFDAIDGKPTHLFFALFAPENSAGVHLKALARISRLFKNPSFRRSIVEAVDAKAIFELISTEDAKA